MNGNEAAQVGHEGFMMRAMLRDIAAEGLDAVTQGSAFDPAELADELDWAASVTPDEAQRVELIALRDKVAKLPERGIDEASDPCGYCLNSNSPACATCDVAPEGGRTNFWA